MASGLSKSVATSLFTNGFNQIADRLELIANPETYLGGWNFLAVASVIDNGLTEVRAVLSLTASRRYPSDGYGHCWCRKDLTDDNEPHSDFCTRARSLYDALSTG
jgi:hypothetical protein